MLHHNKSVATDLDVEYQLVQDRDRANLLIEQIGQRGLIKAGSQTGDVQKAIYELAAELLYPIDVKPRFWHKQILRVGDDTVNPYEAKVRNRSIQAGDLAFVDLGLVLKVEVDLGRTFVIPGANIDPDKFRIRDDSERLFFECQSHYLQNPNMTGQQLYESVRCKAEENGWKLSSQPHAGHLVGQFPHIKILGTSPCDYIRPENTKPMNAPDQFGNRRHWILEIHLVHPEKPFGAFYEDLLTPVSCSSFKPDYQELPNPCSATILVATDTQFKGMTTYR